MKSSHRTTEKNKTKALTESLLLSPPALAEHDAGAPVSCRAAAALVVVGPQTRQPPLQPPPLPCENPPEDVRTKTVDPRKRNMHNAHIHVHQHFSTWV